MKHYVYKCRGTCSTEIEFDVMDDDSVANVKFTRGCNGNLQGIARLVQGQKREEIISRLKGISCAGKPTSCPDQLAHALETIGN